MNAPLLKKALGPAFDELHTDPPRRFDEYLVYVQEKDKVILYAGTHQHLAVDLTFGVSERGGLVLTSGEQRLYAGRLTVQYPLFLSGRAYVHEWYNDEAQRFEIEGRVSNRWLGDIFGCRGHFESRVEEVPKNKVPPEIKPVREEARS